MRESAPHPVPSAAYLPPIDERVVRTIHFMHGARTMDPPRDGSVLGTITEVYGVPRIVLTESEKRAIYKELVEAILLRHAHGAEDPAPSGKTADDARVHLLHFIEALSGTPHILGAPLRSGDAAADNWVRLCDEIETKELALADATTSASEFYSELALSELETLYAEEHTLLTMWRASFATPDTSADALQKAA